MKKNFLLLLLLLVFASRASADGVTFTYVWQNAVDFELAGTQARGSFSLDSSAFNDTSNDAVSESNLLAFSFDVGGYRFELSDTLPASLFWFDSTVDSPAFLGAGHINATNRAGDELTFFDLVGTDKIEAVVIDPHTSTETVSYGNFEALPEPSAWMLVLAVALVTLVAKWKTLFHGVSINAKIPICSEIQ